MASPGVIFELTEESKKHAIKYVEESGFYKNRLADFLGISRPTLDKLLDEDTDFFTRVKQADSIFCKNLIDAAKRKSPFFILRTKYKEEFNDVIKVGFDPEIEMQKVSKIIAESSSEEIIH